MTDPARRVASELVPRGLGAPGRLLADAHRPLSPLLSDVGAALGPLLSVLGGSRAAAIEAFLDDERAIDRLIDHLDDPEVVRAEPG
jgi:hypothetical protein